MGSVLLIVPILYSRSWRNNHSFGNLPSPSIQWLCIRVPAFLVHLMMWNPFDRLCILHIKLQSFKHKNLALAKPFFLYTKPCTLNGQSIMCDLSDFQGCLCLCDLNHRLKPTPISRQSHSIKWLLCTRPPSHELWGLQIYLSPKCPQGPTLWQEWKSIVFPGFFRLQEAESCCSCFT